MKSAIELRAINYHYLTLETRNSRWIIFRNNADVDDDTFKSVTKVTTWHVFTQCIKRLFIVVVQHSTSLTIRIKQFVNYAVTSVAESRQIASL